MKTLLQQFGRVGIPTRKCETRHALKLDSFIPLGPSPGLVMSQLVFMSLGLSWQGFGVNFTERLACEGVPLSDASILRMNVAIASRADSGQTVFPVRSGRGLQILCCLLMWRAPCLIQRSEFCLLA